jgi:lysophospholipase L1-like esterase
MLPFGNCRYARASHRIIFHGAVLLALILCISRNSRAQSPSTGPSTQPHSTTIASDSNVRAHPAWNLSCEKRVAEMQGKPCDIIFIGDSITDNFTAAPTPNWDLVGQAVWEKHYADRNALNFGVGADRTENVLWRLDNMAIKQFHPKVAVILIGTNNNINTPDAIAAGVKAVVAKTQETFAGVKVILISILPNARATQKMQDANKLIAPLGDDKAVFYFDLASKMPKEGNSWKGLGLDRLHLTADGYELWATEMEPLLSKLLGDPAKSN